MFLSVLPIGHIVHNMNDSPLDRNGAVGRPPQGGPPLALLAAISLGLLLAGLVIGVALAGVMPLPLEAIIPRYRFALQDYVLAPTDYHPNARAHRLIAEFILREIRRDQ